MGAFDSQFFQAGDLVFDIGANQGEYSEIFANEGGRVVAVEPNIAFTTRYMRSHTRVRFVQSSRQSVTGPQLRILTYSARPFQYACETGRQVDGGIARLQKLHLDTYARCIGYYARRLAPS